MTDVLVYLLAYGTLASLALLVLIVALQIRDEWRRERRRARDLAEMYVDRDLSRWNVSEQRPSAVIYPISMARSRRDQPPAA